MPKLVLNKAKKTATVHASALPNAAVDAPAVTPVKMEAVKKTIPTVTPVPAGTSLQAVHPLRFGPGQLPRFALAALLPAPATSARLKPVPIHVFILYVLVQPTVIVRAAR